MHAKCSPHHIINGRNQHGLLGTAPNIKFCTMSYFQYCGYTYLKNTNFFFFGNTPNFCSLLKMAALVLHHDEVTDKSTVSDILILIFFDINPLKPELNPICYLLALLGVHHFLHVSRIRVKSLTFRRLMSYKYGAPILDVSRSHTTTQHSR